MCKYATTGEYVPFDDSVPYNQPNSTIISPYQRAQQERARKRMSGGRRFHRNMVKNTRGVS